MMRKERPGPPPGAKRTIRLDVQYEGTSYVGWQRQKNGLSIQEILENALSKVADEKVTLFCSGRTDAGVHARQQVASFSLKESKTPQEAFLRGANTLLPKDVRVSRAEEVDLLSHAPEAEEKTYRYFLQVGSEPLVFLERYSWHIYKELDVEKMRQATEYIIGEHDFAAFRTAGTETQTTVRTIHQATWNTSLLHLLHFDITGSGFLKQMVRNIVGTLVEVGQGKRDPEKMPDILTSKKRENAGAAAPAHGLFLWNVVY